MAAMSTGMQSQAKTLRNACLVGLTALSLVLAFAASAALSASALAAPIALDSADNGNPPLIAYDPTTQTTYVAWSDPHSVTSPGVDLCVLPVGATACEGGAPVLLEDSKYPGYTGDNTPGLGGLVVLPGGEAVVIGTPVSTGSIAWASPAGGAAFLSGNHGLQNGGQFISPVSLFYTFGNAVALSETDVGLLDDYGNFFSDSPLTAESPAIPASNTNPGEQYPRKALFTNGPEIAAEPAPAPAAAGTDIVVGVGSNNSSAQLTPSGCLNDAASGYGVSVGKVQGTSNAKGTLNHEGLPAYQLLACSAEVPVLASGGKDGIGVLEQEGSGVSGAGSDFTLDYRPFGATATGGTFGAPVQLSDVTGEVLDGVDALDLSDDSGTGVYALWEDGQGTVIDYSSNGGATWEGQTVAPPPYDGDDVIAGVGGGNAEIAYDENPGTGNQVFLQPVNYQALVAANSKPTPTAPPAPAPAPTPPNSGYTVSSITGNSNGTVTITFVPTQSGEAVLEVTVPTASIASASATDAKSKKCKHGQTKIKGKCRPKTTLAGRTTGSGTAGVPLKLTVDLSSKIKALLKKGKTVHLAAKLTYSSSLGGAATVKTYSLTVKGKKPKHH
jgi:hypothetical protein